MENNNEKLDDIIQGSYDEFSRMFHEIMKDEKIASDTNMQKILSGINELAITSCSKTIATDNQKDKKIKH